MSRQRKFWLYAIFEGCLILLGQHAIAEFNAHQAFLVNYAFTFLGMKLSFLNWSLILFDYLAIILAMSHVDEILPFLWIRKLSYLKLMTEFFKTFIAYLVPVILVHLLLFSIRDIFLEFVLLLIFSLIWLLCVSMTFIKLNSWGKKLIPLVVLILWRAIILFVG